MKILHVCAEFFPLLKTGGLADVTGALPIAQHSVGIDARILLPAFPSIEQGLVDIRCIATRNTFAGRVRLLLGYYHGLGIYLIKADALYQRVGNPYFDADQQDWPDNYLRFALLGSLACDVALGLDKAWRPALLHAHDWHAGLTSAYLAARGKPIKSLFTLHNLAYQGLFAADRLPLIDLPSTFFSMDGMEFYGQLSYLKAGLFYADYITTVSPTYAQQITTTQYGCGMEGLLQLRAHQGRLAGILNGVDAQVWDPAQDPLLACRYHSRSLQKRQDNKRQLQQQMGLACISDKPLFAIVSRLTQQKGLDLVLAALPNIREQGGQLLVLGAGDAQLQQQFLRAAAADAHAVQVRIGYDEALAHQIYGGADVILVPSRFEPCGLTQLYAQRYGALPLVHRTGGLADTVADCSLENLANGVATGFCYMDDTVAALSSAIQRVFVLWSRPRQWRRVQRQAMSQHVSWQAAAHAYLQLYQRLM